MTKPSVYKGHPETDFGFVTEQGCSLLPQCHCGTAQAEDTYQVEFLTARSHSHGVTRVSGLETDWLHRKVKRRQLQKDNRGRKASFAHSDCDSLVAASVASLGKVCLQPLLVETYQIGTRPEC